MPRTSVALACSLVAGLQPWHAVAECPYLHMGTPPADMDHVPDMPSYDKALSELNLEDVMDDLEALMTHSQDCWPADYGHYGPLFIRMAWHCAGTYRTSDGMGGCAGGRQRFEPERSWEDNVNLEKARALIAPIKMKYGDGLSWGDLMVLAGTAAIRQMGGPATQFCAGRIDAPDGTESLPLGPSKQQEKVAPCDKDGNCGAPLGATHVGLIYVNPEGPVTELADGSHVPVPDPAKSAVEIRDVFARMGMNDTETVALVGGGHAFGKCHGACPRSAGFPPKENIDHPWIGRCGTGKGADAVGSGLEGPWTTTPTKWSNEFFTALRDYEWEKYFGPGGKWQWRVKGATGPMANVMRLTTDIAFVHDDAYKTIVDKFATDISTLNGAFDAAWFKLTHRGGRWSPAKKCISLVDSAAPLYP
eukprot:TRINITY_DN440_c0_g1_i2.p1 TRINITY_DN440_c0_g1~~TRINITY_DN440_c0_g1_i2.p1  ORF type:complete len:418 (+),score=69.34 TRINITY_DN440_c0_g1_i2:71-1324(+)